MRVFALIYSGLNTCFHDFSYLIMYSRLTIHCPLLCRLGDLNNLFTMMASQGIPTAQKSMCSCSVPDIDKAAVACNSTTSAACRQAYRCLRNDRVSVPLLSFEMDITDIILSKMMQGHSARLYIFPWDDVTFLDFELQGETFVRARTKQINTHQCINMLSNDRFAFLCKESLQVDLNEISSYCADAVKVCDL